MEVYAVREQIMSKKLDGFYVFTGDEQAVMWTYVQQIARAAGMRVCYADRFADVYKKLCSTLLKTSACYVIRDDPDWMNDEKLWSRLGTHEKPVHELLGDSIVILLVSNLDKRTRFYKHYKDTVVEFTSLSDSLLVQYIQREISLSEQNCVRLIRACESDYGQIQLEINKIKMFGGTSADDAFQQLLDDGVIHQPPEDAIFKLATAVLSRDARLSFQLLDECERFGEATLVIISVLYTSVKQLLQVQTCKHGDVAKVTGLTSWQIKNVERFKDRYRTRELLRFMERLRNAERGIKRGTVDEPIAVRYVLCECM